eukprot:jgi/Chrzof1/11504/UNPLg00437.t1
MLPTPASWLMDPQAERAKVAPVWHELWAAVLEHGIPNATTPAIRNDIHDFVREGEPIEAWHTQHGLMLYTPSVICRRSVESARLQFEAFKANLPPYPIGVFQGRGIVTVGGGMRYIIPAWINVHQLRHTGCSLPIEMWYPLSEYPSQYVIDAFANLGVTTRALDFTGLDIPEPFGTQAQENDPQNMARFTIKIASIVLSRFREILYLDVDNIPVRDPTYLFELPAFTDTGAVFWEDYWSNTMAPQAEQMLGVPKSIWYPGSFASGQMVVDKYKHWKGLLLSVYLNSNAHFWYEIFTCFLGKGDKETFAYGMAAAGETYSVVDIPPGSLGTTGTSMMCNPRTTLCKDEFTGNTMVQYDPSGNILFLHSNLNKWDMRLPEKFSLHYQRRWQILLPGFTQWEPWSQAHLGYDIERKVYDLVGMLKCQPWWEEYYQDRVGRGDRRTPDLDGFHYLLRGIELDKLYQRGWSGNYIRLLRGLTTTERLRHYYFGYSRPTLITCILIRALHMTEPRS